MVEKKTQEVKKTVLVVENMESLRELLHDELTEEGYKVVTAGSVAEAREIVSIRFPDIIVLDIKLPGESGVDFAKELKAKNVKVPIIFCTAYWDEDTIEEISQAEVADFFLKPFDLEVLKKRIKELLGNI
jgi:two-component system response regulator (stage 0 sporulation protein F)